MYNLEKIYAFLGINPVYSRELEKLYGYKTEGMNPIITLVPQTHLQGLLEILCSHGTVYISGKNEKLTFTFIQNDNKIEADELNSLVFKSIEYLIDNNQLTSSQVDKLFYIVSYLEVFNDR